MNQLTISLTAYMAVLAACQVPYGWAVALMFIIGLLSKKGYQQLSSFGTARWANLADLRERGMLDE